MYSNVSTFWHGTFLGCRWSMVLSLNGCVILWTYTQHIRNMRLNCHIWCARQWSPVLSHGMIFWTFLMIPILCIIFSYSWAQMFRPDSLMALTPTWPQTWLRPFPWPQCNTSCLSRWSFLFGMLCSCQHFAHLLTRLTNIPPSPTSQWHQFFFSFSGDGSLKVRPGIDQEVISCCYLVRQASSPSYPLPCANSYAASSILEFV